ncbi:MAG TPA: septum formation protein Maf [bacterium]|nr:septum formation protein Maf [bacterium]
MDPEIKIILASQSPRRAAILRQVGLRFTVRIPEEIENGITGRDARKTACRLAREKAESVARQEPDALVIGADTLVVLKDRILGKPAGRNEAVDMLKSLSGRTHRVVTGFCLAAPDRLITDSEETRVVFRSLSDWEIRAYVDSGLPMDKAGAYGIQDWGGVFVRKVAGCYYNVVGFPLTKFYTALRELWGESLLEKRVGPHR